MKYAVTVTETLEVTYLVEAPDAERAEEAVEKWAEENEALVNSHLTDSWSGLETAAIPSPLTDRATDLEWRDGEVIWNAPDGSTESYTI